MKIESIRLRNFKAFRDVHLKDMPSFLVVVGANGSGKSTLFDVFGFLHDCLKGNVRQALDKRGRFREVLSRGCDPTVDSILIELQYRMEITGVDVPPSLSSTLVWSPIPYPEEIGREEAFFRRTDHRLPARSRGRHADQGPVPAAWLQ
ncbi:AAA family ATPase [Xanthomonas oryzae]|uniref:AAA family ATPase n=1 Tax=Xanthomonas oryzae TaxID=347 RepID=UPI00349EF3B3